MLKEVAATLLPPDILDRPKQGFGVPLGVWFRGDLRELFADTLLSPASLQRGYFQPRFVRRLVDEHAVRHARSHAAALAARRLRTMAPAVRGRAACLPLPGQLLGAAARLSRTAVAARWQRLSSGPFLIAVVIVELRARAARSVR